MFETSVTALCIICFPLSILIAIVLGDIVVELPGLLIIPILVFIGLLTWQIVYSFKDWEYLDYNVRVVNIEGIDTAVVDGELLNCNSLFKKDFDDKELITIQKKNDKISYVGIYPEKVKELYRLKEKQ